MCILICYGAGSTHTFLSSSPGACITGDNQLYMAGGAIRKINYRGPFSAEGVSANLFMYDKTFGSWQVKAKMANGRSQFALAVVDG